MAVGVVSPYADLGPHIRIAEQVGRTGRAGIHTATQPMIGDGAKAIGIRQRVRRRQRLVFRRRPRDRHRSGRRVVDVGNRRRHRTGDSFRCAMAIGVVRPYADLGPHIRIAEQVGRTGRAGIHTATQPMIGDGAKAIGIRQRVRRRQHLVFRRRPRDRHRPGRGVVHRKDNSRAGGTIAGKVSDLRGQRVATIGERDAAAPATIGQHDGAAERGDAVEDGDGGASIGDIDRASNGLRRLVDRTARAGDGNRLAQWCPA